MIHTRLVKAIKSAKEIELSHRRYNKTTSLGSTANTSISGHGRHFTSRDFFVSTAHARSSLPRRKRNLFCFVMMILSECSRMKVTLMVLIKVLCICHFQVKLHHCDTYCSCFFIAFINSRVYLLLFLSNDIYVQLCTFIVKLIWELLYYYEKQIKHVNDIYPIWLWK